MGLIIANLNSCSKFINIHLHLECPITKKSFEFSWRKWIPEIDINSVISNLDSISFTQQLWDAFFKKYLTLV